MKALVLIASLIFSSSALALESWCIWDGEEYIKESMEQNKLHWLQAVYALHSADDSADVATPVTGEAAFEGVGSCRFIDRNLGETAADVINAYVTSYSTIIATRAYLKMDASNEIVLPKAYYAAGTNWVHVEKDFYSMDRPMCEKQKAQMIDLGKNGSGIRFTDVEYKKNKHGGVSAIINANSPMANYLAVCHFN